jgi:transformation/transcription domain-associated protein
MAYVRARWYYRFLQPAISIFSRWTLKKDNIAKSHAFLCVAHFFRAYLGNKDDENDINLVLKAFFNMLRMNAHDSATREAVKQAIDYIIPILGEQTDEGGDSDLHAGVDTPDGGKKRLIFPSALKRLLREEGMMSPVMVLVMQMVVRNREAFYSSRLSFIPVILASLNKYGLPNQSTIDSRILAVDMAVTMYWWDEKAKAENISGGKATLLTKEMDTSILNFLLRMTFVRYVRSSRISFSHLTDPILQLDPAISPRPVSPAPHRTLCSCEVRDRDETGWKKLHAHCLSTLCDAAKYRTNCSLKLQFFEKLLHNSAQQQKQQAASGKSVGPNPVLLTGLRIFSVFMEHQPVNLVECCHQQLALMIEPSIYNKNLNTIEPFSTAIRHFYAAFPDDLAATDAASLTSPGATVEAADVKKHFVKTLEKYLTHISEVEQFSTDVFWFACNCVRVMKGATESSPRSMDEVLLLLLRAMNRVAKEHSKQPQLGLLSSKGMPQESLSNAEFGSGAWFMYHALEVSVPSALVLSSDHRKLFLSTVVELMAGNPVRQGQTHSGILFSVMRLLRDWLLDDSVDYLNSKESLVLLQRLAQVDRLHAIPTVLRKVWDKDFLDFLYTLITTDPGGEFANDVFTKVERPFCCGLQNPDPAVRAKFFKLYSERIPRDLFARLRYIIQTQEWEFLSNTFWLKHAVALLFDCLHMEDPVTLAYNSAHVPQLFDYKESLILPTKDKSGGGTSAENEPAEVVAEDDTGAKHVTIPEATEDLLRDHIRFLKEESGLRSVSLVSCLIEQVQTDPLVAHHLWVLLFPIVWTSLEKEQQTGLAKPIIHLLSKEHHIRQSLLRPTVGQTLLDGISMSQPQPKIPAEMIKYMGRHFHAWHTAISMLESHVGLFPHDMRCFDAVCDLYSILGEEDMKCGLWQRRASAPETSMAMAFQQHGFVPQAQSIFLEMMSRAVSGDVGGFTKSEMVLWHNQYLSCCMELNQWEVVAEYAKSVDNSALRLEASAKLYDWSYLKTMIAPNAQVEEGPEFTLVKAQMQMSDMTLLDVDKMCKTALSQCITRWWQMPETSPWSYASVLHSFQRTVELMESWRVMMEFSMQGGQAGHYQELKDIADTWKLRTPNEWEPVHWWSDILTWRNHVYNTTIRQFSNLQNVNPNLHQLGYRDKAWSVNRLGHVARLHHLPEACIRIINTLYGFNAMEVQEAFVKVQEQAKAYMQKPSQYIQGLNLINSTNMDYFNPNHHAEMHALKGEFLHRLNDPKAHDTFSEALSLWPLCIEGWINWGKYCDTQYTIASQNEQKMQQENGNKPLDPVQSQQTSTWLEYTATCYIQAIRCSATQGVSLVPRLLRLLALEGNGQLVGKHLIQHLGDIPAWIWLPWLPQMIVGLQRPEEATVKHILGVSATHHPQYVYWQMRPALAHLKDVAYKAMSENEAKKDEEMPDASVSGAPNSATGTPPAAGKVTASASTPVMPDSIGDSPPEYLAYCRAKQVMEPLRAKQATLQTLDLFITELGQRFTARTDERLLAVVYTLQHRTYRVMMPASAEIPETLCKELSSVCKACSSAASSTSKGGVATGTNSWSHWNAYQIKFANDLDMSSETAPKNLGELTERLKGWRTMMEAIIEDTNPSLLRLEDISPALMDMAVDEIMMPCQAPPSPSIPEPLYVEKMCADVRVVRRACSSSRRIAITGNDGQIKHFLVMGQQNSGQGSGEERIGQLLRAANALLDSHPESRRRDLKFAAPRSHLLYPGGKIMEDDEANCLFIDAYETFCARYGKEPDAPIVKFKEMVYGEPLDENLNDEERRRQHEERRRKAFNEIVDPDKGIVGENIFSQYMYKTMIENSKTMWTFKRQFAGSVALSSLASFVLRLSGRTPSKLVISKASGALTHIELVTSYNDRLQLDLQGEPVPFRFTRNMSTFIGQQGLEGHKISSAVAAAQALSQSDDTRMSSLLALFLLPDILAFIARRLNVRSVAAIETVTPVQIQHAIMHNVVQSISRLERVAPQVPNDPTQEPENPTKAMRDLFAMSGAPSNLCKHPDVTWLPWY